MLRNLLGAFQFSGDDVQKRIRALSGEKTRLVMARMLLDPPNLLVLDEPTNHLDLATKEMLVKALGDFDGTMLFVSHDRAFLRGLSNRVLELGGETGTDEPHAYRAPTSSTWNAPVTKHPAFMRETIPADDAEGIMKPREVAGGSETKPLVLLVEDLVDSRELYAQCSMRWIQRGHGDQRT